jgi:hypothetical protein
MKEDFACWLRRYVVCTQPHEAESKAFEADFDVLATSGGAVVHGRCRHFQSLSLRLSRHCQALARVQLESV